MQLMTEVSGVTDISDDAAMGSQQLITHLNIDAIEKVKPKLGHIFIATALNSSDNRTYVELRIQDNGCGIPNEIKEKIYLKGFTTRKSENGTGLGLYLVKELLSSHGSRIYFDSNVGKGTTWYIRFPLDGHRSAEDG